jgi:hypothetical protein
VCDRSRIPFNLFLDETLVEDLPIITEALQLAVSFINESIGHEMFVKVGSFSPGAIVPVMKFDSKLVEGQFHEGSFSFVQLNNSEVVAIYIDVVKAKLLDSDMLKFGLAHELGHVIGLDHDEFTRSVMLPKLLDRDVIITERDIDFIRTAYGIQKVPQEVAHG